VARILFTWELGGGFGHLVRYMGTFRALRDRGHEVTLVVRDLANTEKVFGPETSKGGFRFLQAPVQLRPPARPVRQLSYAHLLQAVGFGDADGLAGRIRAWHGVLDHVRPDLVIHDHSPTAALACHALDCPRYYCGSGFLLPPCTVPLPPMRYWESVTAEQLRAAEAPVLDVIGAVASRLGGTIKSLDNLAGLFEEVRPVLLTHPELDHYPDRGAAEYFGAPLSDGDFGERAGWPAGTGPRVFAYLSPFKTLGALFDELARIGARTLVYGPEIPVEVRQRHAGKSIRFVDRPLSIGQMGSECDLAINHANLATVTEMLLAGKPVLMLPTTLERQMLARRVAALGAGLAAPRLLPEGMATKLRALIEDARYRSAAERFAAKYGATAPRPDPLLFLIDAALAGAPGNP
jgi:hypothetical protein